MNLGNWTAQNLSTGLAMDTCTKEKIASLFFRYPALCMLVRTLLYSYWFRLCFVGALLLPVALTLVFARIWRTTPRGFLPVVRVSALDWLQAKSLQRTAMKELRLGRIREGILSYSLAVGNNPGDLVLVRGFLREVQAHADPPQFQGPALARAFWLLRLTETNLLDLEVAAGVFEKYGLSEYLIHLLAPLEPNLTPELQKAYLRTLFNNGRVAEFDRFWNSRMLTNHRAQDPELQLYRTAFTAGWGATSPAGLAYDDLKARSEDPKWRVIGHQLRLLVCERWNRLDEYLSVLERLREWKKDRLINHVRAWRLLASNGQRQEAIERATRFSETPTTALETLQLVQAYFALGLREAARKLLDQFTVEFSFIDGLWVLYGNLLIESEDWDRLRQLALSIRLNNDVREHLSDLSHYFEGRAELALSRTVAAGKAFQQIGLAAPDNPELALAIADGLQQVGHPQAAHTLLSRIESRSERNFAYWEQLAAVAFALKDADLLLRAAGKAVALNPESWTARNNYAAASITNRRDPGEAIKTTFRLITERPEIPAIRINHAQALIQNHRYGEADRVLAGIQPKALNDSERAVYQFACFETLVRLRRYDLARKFLEEIDPGQLFPTQREFLNRLAEELPKKSPDDR